MAQEMGALLGRSALLLESLSQCQTAMRDEYSIADCRDLRPAIEVSLVCGDQLNTNHSWFGDSAHPDRLFVLMEVRSETDYARHHIQKVVAFFGAMRLFARSLRNAGHRVHYLALDDPMNGQSFPANLDWICKETGAQRFNWQRPDEYRLDSILREFASRCQEQGLEVKEYDTEHFYTQRDELAIYFQGKKTYRLENFYRSMRKKHQVLLDAVGEPEGGQWNFDANNRQKLPADHVVPPPKLFHRNVTSLVAMLQSCGVETVGELNPDDWGWPLTRSEGLELLDYFVAVLLPRFGDFQDALTTSSWSVYHSRLSFLLNSKLLSPKEVVLAVESNWRMDKQRIGISQVEGFIRQIIGWREYMRGVYWAHMPAYGKLNFFNHQRKLPDWFWTGNTKMKCLSHAIGQTMEFAYAHHIQRLMVTGNFLLLAGIHPDEVDAWYLGVYIDALEWVEITNTRGMSQFADGGIVGSKPYVSSAQYLKKMGPYCKNCHYKADEKTGDRACPFNGLYWDFHARHREVLSRNPRIGMVYRTWDKMAPEKQQSLLETAAMNLERIEKL